MNNFKENKLKKLFLDWCGEEASQFDLITGSGSNRQYFRLVGNKSSAIGVIGENKQENKAFLTLTTHFLQHGLAVPQVYLTDETEGIYLLQDLGNISLFSLVEFGRGNITENSKLIFLYRKVLDDLICFQVEAAKDLDYSFCYPRDHFDRQSMQWDLNYFKYYYLRPGNIPFHEDALEKDFQILIDFLAFAESDYFMYRDFQSRNILIYGNKPWYIDYQGGRKGPLQYDLASLLFQAKANLPHAFREQMLEYYIAEAKSHTPINRDTFIPLYYGFVLIRLLQVLGAYGYRGYFERKSHFIDSIQYALKNVKWLLENVEFAIKIPELNNCLNEMVKEQRNQTKAGNSKLTVDIISFSYLQQGYPAETSGNGGGFVFDCRGLPNPGRFEKFKKLSGLDEPVKEYLGGYPEVESFLNHATEMVSQTIEEYIRRGFDHLSVNFGCTGGQHRSVYCAEQFISKMNAKYAINLSLTHSMKERWLQ